METPRPFNQRLRESIDKRGSRLCVGLDIDLALLPRPIARNVAGADAFLATVIEATAPFAAAYKPNLAFFLALGSGGFDLLLSLRDRLPPEAILIGDAKWGDIGNTARKYADTAFEVLRLDAVTVNPYQGADAVAPFLVRPDKGAFVVCRTSNPSSGDFQDGNASAPLYLKVAETSETWNQNGNCGLVVGATAPEVISRIRQAAPNASFLVPGVGAQGGDLAATAAALGGEQPSVFLINASRSILYAEEGDDYWKGCANRAKQSRDTINLAAGY